MFLLLLIIFCTFYKCKIVENKNYLSLYQTTSVNGIFILLVFFRHLNQYVSFHNTIDIPMILINKFSGQLIVTMFLFSSGYGIMESIKNKEKYIDTIPKKRILSTWIKFAICVIIYFIINILIGKRITLLKLILSLLSIESIGNSNWYILAMLILWLYTYISFKFFNKNKQSIICLSLLILIYIIVMKVVNYPNYYYNTIICYLYGIFYSLNKEKIDNTLKKNKYWIISLIISLISFCIFILIIHKNANNTVVYEIMSLSFTNCIILSLRKMEFGNKFTYFLGKNLFGLYMLQRIPMIILREIGIADFNIYIYASLCFITMIILGYVFNKLANKVKI